jgi:two-component system cell cycle response regulator DivK
MSRPAVLIVDDNAVNLELYSELMEMTECRAVLVDRADMVVDAALRGTPSLILLDINLPGSSGQAVAAQLRAQSDLAAVPIIALTAIRHESLAIDLRRAGFSGLIAKPCGVGTFLAAVAWGLKGASAEFKVFG